jgi:hypothetical protein
LIVLTRLLFVTAFVAWPLAVQAIDIEMPKIGLTSVPIEIVVIDLTAGAEVSLGFADTSRHAMADDDGRAVFDDLLVEQRGVVVLEASADGAMSYRRCYSVCGWAQPLCKDLRR